MAGYPPPYPPPGVPPGVPPNFPGYDPREQRRALREQARAARDQARYQTRLQRDAYRAQRDQFRYQVRGLRRSSVLGPILLISVGVIFLLQETGRLPREAFWGWYGRWWPLLLVVAGGVLLAEWSYDQFAMRDPEHPRYRRSIGGGVFLLLLIFAICGVTIGQTRWMDFGTRQWFNGMHLDQNNLDEFLGDKHESDQPIDHALAAGDSLAIDNPRGSVTLTGTSDDGMVHINVHKQVYTQSDADAEKKAQQFAPQVDSSGGTLSVHMPTMEGARADLVILAPAGTATSITANHGDIHASGMKAAITTTANHGDIELSAITGQVTAHVNNGGSSISAHSVTGGVSIEGHANDMTFSDITGPISMRGEFFGSTHLEHITGAVRFHTSRTDFQLGRLDGEVDISPNSNLSADQAVGPVVLTTSGRNITLDRIAGDVTVTNRNGTVDVTSAPPLGNVTIQDKNGSVKLVVPEHAGFTVQAGTSDGEIDTDFALTSSGSDSRKSVSGTVGVGGPQVHIVTTHGDVSMHKGLVEPLPVAPPGPAKITLTPPKITLTPRPPVPPVPTKTPVAPVAPPQP